MSRYIYIYLFIYMAIGDVHFRHLTSGKKKKIGDEMTRRLKIKWQGYKIPRVKIF